MDAFCGSPFWVGSFFNHSRCLPQVVTALCVKSGRITKTIVCLDGRAYLLVFVFVLPVQNTTTTWEVEDPDFNICFEKTVLVWIPCVFLWCLSPLDVLYIAKSRLRSVPWSWLNISKLVSAFSGFWIVAMCILMAVSLTSSHILLDTYCSTGCSLSIRYNLCIFVK